MTRRSSALALLWTLCLTPLCCAEPPTRLVVRVRTDLAPGAEIARVETAVEGVAESESLPAEYGDRRFFDPGVRVASLEGLPASSARRISVRLLDDRGGLVAEREAIVDNRASLEITLLITRDCVGVSCESGGAAVAACLGGACVEPDCLTGEEPGCAEDPECAIDEDCPLLASCATALCEQGICLYAADDDLCGEGEYCAAEEGCERRTDCGAADLASNPFHCGACGNACGPRSACVAGECLESRRVFVSDAPVANAAALRSALLADARCDTLAEQAGLGGTFMAWLSDSLSSPSTRFERPSVAYRRLDGALVAESWEALTDGSLDAPIILSEALEERPREVWTGTGLTGALSSTCGDWTNAGAGGPFATVGQSDYLDVAWTDVFLQECFRSNVHLYCFEQ